MVEMGRRGGGFKEREGGKEGGGGTGGKTGGGRGGTEGEKRQVRLKEGKERGGGGEVNDKEGWKVGFWNVAGIRRKDREFWKGLEEWEVIVLIETWLEEKDWGKIKGILPKGYEWKLQGARKRNRKGRAMGGMLIGVRKEMAGRRKEEEDEGEGMISVVVEVGGEEWRIGGVYVNGDLGRKLEGIKNWMKGKKRGMNTIVGGDFNARTGREGGEIIGEEGEEEGRRSKDVKVNREGRRLLDYIGEEGWLIFNGGIEGDEEGEYTYTGGTASTVIDYVIGDIEVKDKVIRMEVGEKVDSDHHPLEVTIRGEGGIVKRRYKGGRRVERGVWTEEGRQEFREKLGRVEIGEGSVEEELERMQERIKGAWRREREETGVKRGWWDEECGGKKKELRKELREWRRGGVDGGQRYREKRKEYKELCERKKKEEREGFEKEVDRARTEQDIWRIVNRERRKRKKIEEGIGKEEWREHFMKMLGGVEEKVVRGMERRGREAEEREIDRGEIRRVLGEIKDGKAMGADGIPGEAWKYGGEEVERWVWEMCNRVWRGEGWPEGWREGIIVPIMKKGEGSKVEDYRGVTLLQTLYKVYVAVLAGRLREEVEEKEMLPHNQTGFRKGMGTVDNIYVLNYLVNRRVGIKKGGMTAVFLDLKAAFDSVDRGVMVRAMRERGVRKGLIERVEEVYRETRNRVKVEGEVGKEFWTARGVRQGCPLSPILFSLMTADMEEEMRKGGWGGVRLGEEKVYTLAYADDVVVMAEREEDMIPLIRRLEKYLDGKKLEVNAEKTKVIRFRKGGGRRKKVEWKWKGKSLEEVRKIKYLGYMISSNAGQEEQVKDRVKKAAGIMGQVWGIGKRRFGKEWERRVWLFDRLVWPVIGYGAEIWGWKERKGIERLQERYLRWVLGVEWRTPGYLMREELKRGKLRVRAAKMAWNFERKMGEGKGSEIARKCWEEIGRRERRYGELTGWEEERRDFLKERRGDRREERGEGEEQLYREERWEELERRDLEMQERERWERIRESRSHRWYKELRCEGIPGYMKMGWGESRWRRVARFRLGNEVREGEYWRTEEERKCRVCGWEEETWEHVWEGCTRGEVEKRSWGEEVGVILGERGEGEWWMKEVEEIREKKKRQEEIE